MIPSLAFVVVLLLPFLSNVAGIPCTEGFMDLSLLETKAADTSGTDVRNLAKGKNRKWGIAYSFIKSTCTATLTHCKNKGGYHPPKKAYSRLVI